MVDGKLRRVKHFAVLELGPVMGTLMSDGAAGEGLAFWILICIVSPSLVLVSINHVSILFNGVNIFWSAITRLTIGRMIITDKIYDYYRQDI